jgi:IS5 family transposase
LKGTSGDALFAVLCACGHNIRKILAHLRAWLALIIAAILVAQTAPDRQDKTLTSA